ncbi:hypothetical protein TNCV_1410461 [Trichonephila clavipes]|nr:hypothetical protein TNCV_1410461 [Trichonephila clavipes]
MKSGHVQLCQNECSCSSATEHEYKKGGRFLNSFSTPPGFHRLTNRHLATQQNGKHHFLHAQHHRPSRYGFKNCFTVQMSKRSAYSIPFGAILPRKGTLNSRRAISPLVRLVAGDERWEAPVLHPGCSLSKFEWNRAKSYCHLYVAQGYGQRHLASCHEFRGPPTV